MNNKKKKVIRVIYPPCPSRVYVNSTDGEMITVIVYRHASYNNITGCYFLRAENLRLLQLYDDRQYRSTNKRIN